MDSRPAGRRKLVIHHVVQLAVTALVVSLVFAATSSTPSVPGAAPSTASIAQLPPTQPGLSSDEGIFLVTNADDGGSAAYFIAGDARHSIVVSDMQVQVQLNPLRPVHAASRVSEANASTGGIGRSCRLENPLAGRPSRHPAPGLGAEPSTRSGTLAVAH